MLLKLQKVQTLFHRLPATKEDEKEQRSWVFKEDVERIFWEVMKENNWKPEDFAAEETKDERSVSSSIYVCCSQ